MDTPAMCTPVSAAEQRLKSTLTTTEACQVFHLPPPVLAVLLGQALPHPHAAVTTALAMTLWRSTPQMMATTTSTMIPMVHAPHAPLAPPTKHQASVTTIHMPQPLLTGLPIKRPQQRRITKSLPTLPPWRAKTNASNTLQSTRPLPGGLEACRATHRRQHPRHERKLPSPFTPMAPALVTAKPTLMLALESILALKTHATSPDH